MIRFHFSSAASSVEILDLRNAGSDLGALGINQNFRKKTEFCLKSALFSLNASEKGKILFLRAAALRRRQPKKLNLLPVRRLLRIGSRRSRERLSGSRRQRVAFLITVKRNACKFLLFLLFLFLFCTRKENDSRERSSLSKPIHDLSLLL